MSKVIIHAPGIDQVAIDGVKSFKLVASGTAFFSGNDFSGVCLGIAPSNAIVEMITDDE